MQPNRAFIFKIAAALIVACVCACGGPHVGGAANETAYRRGADPKINEEFRAPDLEPEKWRERFEGESREVYANRDAIVAACGLRSGSTIADIGAGTGFFTMLFADAVGPAGRVMAVDISPKFIEYIASRTRKAGVANVTTVLCKDDSVELADGSLDAAFICDTYHHFEHPEGTMRSLNRAMKPGARLIVIDFERIDGVSREWILNHVRFGKLRVIDEIESFGFELTDDVKIPGLKENYCLRFRKGAG